MRVISDKIRYYRKTFRPPIFYALGSQSLWLSVALALLILGLLLIDLYLRIHSHVILLELSDQVCLLLFEIPLVFGMLQAYLEGSERRHRLLHPSTQKFSLRIPDAVMASEKRAHLRANFQHEADFISLAKLLVDEWEWRKEVKLRADEPLLRGACRFFGFPSASNFAAYLTGLVAVFAGIVIATMTPGVIFESFDEFLNTTWALIRTLWLVIVVPFAVCVLPVAAILSVIKNIGESLLEWTDDQFLSNTAFYRFISELLDLHDRSESLLLRKTRTRVYWIVRLGTVPLQDVAKVLRRIWRARALSKRTGKPL